jgi:putative sterol carrier protein
VRAFSQSVKLPQFVHRLGGNALRRSPARATSAHHRVEENMDIAEITKRFAEATAVVPGKKVKFDFGDAGKVFLDGVANTVSNDDAAADTTIKVSLDDFIGMAQGKLDATMAFMQGKLKVDGDMGVAMQLQGVMAKLRG